MLTRTAATTRELSLATGVCGFKIDNNLFVRAWNGGFFRKFDRCPDTWTPAKQFASLL